MTPVHNATMFHKNCLETFPVFLCSWTDG